MSDSAAVAILLHAALAAATVVAYVLARPPRPARLAGYRGLIAVLGGWAYWVTRPMHDAAARLGLTPNAVTAYGLVLNVLAGLAASQGAWGWAGVLLVWGSIGDLLDGELARSTGQQSPAGAFLDSNLDRVSEIALFAGFAVAFPDRAGVGWAVAALSGSVMVSYARARGEGLGVACPTFGLERPHRVVLLMAALLAAAFLEPVRAVALVEGACALIAVGAGATALGRMVVIHQLLRRGDAGAAAPGTPPEGAA
ncbi:CDP-alcohol phosphatidyltransferase family protein [Anaeromyxobacter oryzae]|nr:CDP-alcohol phosphatidyltransferase family protein [Anaeromyxobacter oryzae]